MLCNEHYELDNRNTGLQGKITAFLTRTRVKTSIKLYTLVQFH